MAVCDVYGCLRRLWLFVTFRAVCDVYELFATCMAVCVVYGCLATFMAVCDV